MRSARRICFFRNEGNGKFSEQTSAFGLEDYLITAAAVAADIDHDGDVDFISGPVNGPVMAFINNAQAGNAIAFEFRDWEGNRFGIGNRIEIRYGHGVKQMREVQSGGGFMSFDAPVLHFGLGEAKMVDSIKISWSNGGELVIDSKFPAGATYRIERRKAATG